MPTIDEFAAHYARRLLAATDERSELRLIAADIKILVYQECGCPLTLADRDHLVGRMEWHLSGADDEPPEHECTKIGGTDNTYYLQLVSALRSLIR